MQRLSQLVGRTAFPIALLGLSTLAGAQTTSNTAGVPTAAQAAAQQQRLVQTAPQAGATAPTIVGWDNATAPPTTGSSSGAPPTVITTSAATACLNGVIGDTSLGGGWGAFERASGLSMEVLISPAADFTDITTLPSSLGNVVFNVPHNQRVIGGGWGSWSHGYTGQVFYTNGATAASYRFPAGTAGADMYVEPNPFSPQTFTATGHCSDGTTATVVFDAEGLSGANHFGFFVQPGFELNQIDISATSDYAMGEIRVGARACVSGMVGDTTLGGGWGAFEAASGLMMEVLTSGVADFTDVTSIPSSRGPVLMNVAHNKRTIGSGWGTWSHGYTGEVFYSNGAIATSYRFPAGTRGVDMYVEPNPFSLQPFSARGICSDGTTTTVNFDADGTSGARHFGFFTRPGAELLQIDLSGATDYAIGEIRISACTLGTSYCGVNTNSTGSVALISACGSPRISDNNFTLTAFSVPDQPYIFFHASNKLDAPFGNGHLCAGGGIVRLNPPMSASGNMATRSVDLISDGFVPGIRHFQCWFRDPAAGGSFFNTSNGLRMTFVP